jgi:hypothetical protein
VLISVSLCSHCLGGRRPTAEEIATSDHQPTDSTAPASPRRAGPSSVSGAPFKGPKRSRAKNGAPTPENEPPRAHTRGKRAVSHAQHQDQDQDTADTPPSTTTGDEGSADVGTSVPYAPSGVEIVTLFEDVVLEAPRDVQLRGLWDRMLDEHAGQ